jgi:amino acid transporter
MAVSAGAGKVFTWFSHMTSIAGLMTWFGISLTYLRFYAGLKAQNINREDLPYHTKFQPFAAWYAMISCIVISLVRSDRISYGDIFLKEKPCCTDEWMVCIS